MTERRATVELTADLCDGVWDLDAYYPAVPGENLPFAQTVFEYAAQGQLPLRWALEKGLGIENPEDILVEIAVERLLQTPAGQSLILNYAAQDAQDQALAELEKAVIAGLATQDGTPTSALTGMGGGMNPAQAALGGIVGGAMGTQSINNAARATAV